MCPVITLMVGIDNALYAVGLLRLLSYKPSNIWTFQQHWSFLSLTRLPSFVSWHRRPRCLGYPPSFPFILELFQHLCRYVDASSSSLTDSSSCDPSAQPFCTPPPTPHPFQPRVLPHTDRFGPTRSANKTFVRRFLLSSLFLRSSRASGV